MNLGESASISNKKENELIKKKDPMRSGILWWASQNFTCQEMLEKWYPKWDDPRSSSTNYRHILYYLSRYSRYDMLDILITRDPKLNLKVSYDGELLPLNAAVWTNKREHIEIIRTIDILLTKYKLQIFATANDTDFSNETIFEALFSTHNPILPDVRREIWEWLVNLPEEFFPFQEFLNKITEKTFEKLQPKLIFMLHRNYIFIQNNEESIKIIKQLFRQFMSIKLPKIEYNNFISIIIRLLFPSEPVPTLQLYLPVINLLESRDIIIKTIIDNADMLINEEYINSFKKDNSIVENDYKILSYRILLTVLGDCYKIGIMKDYIMAYLLSNINSNNKFVKLWINRAIVHFLIQSEFNIKTNNPIEKSFISSCINKCLIGKSTKDKTEFSAAFKILLKSNTMPSEADILKFLDDKENVFDNNESKSSIEKNETEIIKVIDDTIIISNITNRINKLHKDDLENYKDDFKEILTKSSMTDREKCIAILNGLYDLNLKTCTLIKDFVIFLEQNIDSFKLLFQTIIMDKMDEIEDIEIDNPSIIEIIKLFI
jgi:hypothetical protein